jgi:hypothetical protein
VFLSASEMAELTGYKQPARQIRWLTTQRYRFEVGGDGLPKVARSFAEARLGAPIERKPAPRLDGLSYGKKTDKIAQLAT